MSKTDLNWNYYHFSNTCLDISSKNNNFCVISGIFHYKTFPFLNNITTKNISTLSFLFSFYSSSLFPPLPSTTIFHLSRNLSIYFRRFTRKKNKMKFSLAHGKLLKLLRKFQYSFDFSLGLVEKQQQKELSKPHEH